MWFLIQVRNVLPLYQVYQKGEPPGAEAEPGVQSCGYGYEPVPFDQRINSGVQTCALKN